MGSVAEGWVCGGSGSTHREALPGAVAVFVSSSSDLFLRICEPFWCPKKPLGMA